MIDGSEDIAYTFSAADLLTGVTDADVDADGVADVDNLEVINLSVTNGELSYDPDTTTYTFQPDANFNGIARFNYSITDNNGGTVSNTVELNIVPVNDAPTATFDVDQTVAENSNALTGLLTSIDADGNDGTTLPWCLLPLMALILSQKSAVSPSLLMATGILIPKTPPTTLC